MDIISSFLNTKKSSKDVAKERLKLVVVHDRVNCSTQLLELLKIDILKVIKSYMDIDDDGLMLQITQASTENNDNVPVLYANIPIKNMRKMTS